VEYDEVFDAVMLRQITLIAAQLVEAVSRWGSKTQNSPLANL